MIAGVIGYDQLRCVMSDVLAIYDQIKLNSILFVKIIYLNQMQNKQGTLIWIKLNNVMQVAFL